MRPFVARLKRQKGLLPAGTIVRLVPGFETDVPTDPTYPPDIAPVESATGAVNPLLRWAPPTLVNPITWTVTSSANASRVFAPDQDVIINTPVPITWRNGIVIQGGRNIVWMGGEIQLNTPAYTGQAGSDAAKLNRGVYVVGNKGAGTTTPRTIHIEGLKITGTEVWEGINIDMINDTRATVQIQNYYCQRVNWRLPPGGGTHDGGDVLQPWRGPWRLRVDRLTAPECTYQGLFLQPVKFPLTGDATVPFVPLDLYQFRNMQYRGVDGRTLTPASPKSTAQLMNVTNPDVLGPSRRTCYNVYVDPNGTRTFAQSVGGVWNGIQQGQPATPFVNPNSVGIGYVSPGYENA